MSLIGIGLMAVILVQPNPDLFDLPPPPPPPAPSRAPDSAPAEPTRNAAEADGTPANEDRDARISGPPVPPGPAVPAEERGGSAEDATDSMLQLLRASGVIGLLLGLLSIALVAMSIDQFLLVREGTLAPARLVDDLKTAMAAEDYSLAESLCLATPSYLSVVVLAGLAELRRGYSAVEKGMEDASVRQANALFRRIEYFAVLGNTAPMLGLLGTVYGILLAFKRVAEVAGPAIASDLAQGVYLALVTTVLGLLVGIPAVGLHTLFRNRAERLAGEASLIAERLFLPYKRSGDGADRPDTRSTGETGR